MTAGERSRKAREKWQKLISEQGRSGQTVATFCRERRLCAPHFFWWKRRLAASGAGRFLEVKWTTTPPLPGAGCDSRVEVVLRNGRSLRVGRGFDAEQVRTLIAVVESAA